MITRAFGETIPGLKIDGVPAPYPVLNERAVRAGAGIMLLLGIIAFIPAFFLREFLLLQIIVTYLLFEFGFRIFINPKYTPISILANWIVRRQRPEFVGAIQKKFAWGIGFALALIMFILVNIFGIIHPINLVICGICLTVMYFETSFGICIGCKMYNFLIKKGILNPKIKEACPGGSCSLK